MKTTRVVIAGMGWADRDGVGGTGGAPRRWVDLGARGPGDLVWSALTPAACSRFGRMDLLSRAAVVAVEMIGPARLTSGAAGQQVAVVTGTRHGCWHVDAAYYRDVVAGIPGSPSLFAYTVGSSAGSEVSIRYGLRGEQLCVMAGEESASRALIEGFHLVAEGQWPRCLVIACDVDLRQGRPEASAYAVLLARAEDTADPAEILVEDRLGKSLTPAVLCQELRQSDRTPGAAAPTARLKPSTYPPYPEISSDGRPGVPVMQEDMRG